MRSRIIATLVQAFLCIFWEGTAEIEKVNLADIGYYGMWDEFCDPTEITQDFAVYPDHDLKQLRTTLCRLTQNDTIDRDTAIMFAVYKYCNSIRSETEDIYKQLKVKFHLHTDHIIGQLTASESSGTCYTQAIDVFHQKCTGKNNPCTVMFKSLLSEICSKAVMTSKDIGNYIVEVCHGKYISDDINWDVVINNITYGVLP